MATREQIVEWIADAGPLTHANGDPREAGPRAPAAIHIDRVAAVPEADRGCAVFAVSAPTLVEALASKAGLVLVSQALQAAAPPDERVIFVRDARLAFSLLAARLQPRGEGSVHASAQVSASATLGPGCIVGAGAVIGDGAVLGADCIVGARVVIEPGVVFGNRVRVQAGAVLGSLGFGYARKPDGGYVLFPQQGTLLIEDDVEIGANSTIDRGALGETRIGAGTKIDNLVHVGHNCRIGRNVILAAQTGISGSTVVEDGAILGGQVGIGEHALVGPGVILGGGAGVLSGKKLRGPGQVFWGRPAQPLKQYLRDLAKLRRNS